MNDDTNAPKNEYMKTYWSNEVCGALHISTSTLRKWSIALESAGYSFIRDKNDRRAYLERDLMPLHKMRDLLDDGMTMENAAKAVVLRFSEQMSQAVTLPLTPDNERSEERYTELAEHMQGIRQENRELRDSLERLEHIMTTQNERMNVQNENMTQLLREMLETKRMIAAANERSLIHKLMFWKKGR